ncbi:2-amino-4-hydroxy-6-hydroxymethyldihydropteridine diphosphokinase [Halospina denitrificans]|uniref:2-amino-4-hydroxy-6-hydroxymethyldihydropteridine pyrophosphokinase n=1 Tax=Halospina denitrificans TaxID=332522 RepID=A0A4R7K161_9GAMM|nr:2-amino-4-hydroxy-6-hydroxymethyldihydropteridine diphosphokinase [Halospina denitrificans]TDT44590.1 2-amino-4-hydroxy-6-hydroxymethyldihydropteridine diphosphokinase [Halospina denitrificans]
MSETAWIGLGSNLDTPLQQLHLALEALNQIPDSWLLDASPVYQSRPVGPADQPDFLNMAAKLATDLEPLALLDELLAIEDTQGRVRNQVWGPRLIDLDLLIFGNQTLDEPRLKVPHPELANRDFVLQPLLDMDPDLTLPDGTALSQLREQCPDNHLSRLTHT